ncbi:MAG: lipid-A-disaccharide synthase [Phycisphaerae bacterium]|nr:lipid-A-disaccharide synthase [Phycisphaerae bacterium]
MPLKIFISVADASGDRHAAEFITALRQLHPDIHIRGVGGPRMTESGAMLFHETVGGAAMGWRGALRALEVIRLLRRVRRRFQEDKPDLHVCIDSSAMNLPFAKMAKSMGIPVLYYIAPQLWASRESRIKQVRRYVDKVACILPFEEGYYRSHGVDATFVGHPLFDELPVDRPTPAGPSLDERPPIVGIVPGSRRGEVKANLPHQLDVARRISEAFPGTHFLIPTTSAVDAAVRQQCAGQNLKLEIKLNAFDELIPRCDLVICKSGTSTLHVAAWGVPMIVVYRLNPLIWHGIARWLIKTKKIALVNILAGNVDLVPEFVPWHGSNKPVADLAISMLRNPQTLADQRAKLLALVAPLDHRGASKNTASIALELAMKNRSDKFRV